jgi:hypothetical protein
VLRRAPDEIVSEVEAGLARGRKGAALPPNFAFDRGTAADNALLDAIHPAMRLLRA